MQIDFTDHEYIATHEALARYVKHLEKSTSRRADMAMMLTSAANALDGARQKCPPALLPALGLAEVDGKIWPTDD